MRLFLFSLCFMLGLPGLSAVQNAGELPPFRPLCDTFASPFEQLEAQECGFRCEEAAQVGEGTQGEVTGTAPGMSSGSGERGGSGEVGLAASPEGPSSAAAAAAETAGGALGAEPSPKEAETSVAVGISEPAGIAEPEGISEEAGIPEEKWDPATLPSLRCRILLTGDTMMEDFALQLNRDLRPRRGYRLQVVTRRSACLSSSGRFNFAEKLEDVINEDRPDLVVLLLGCWDDVAIRTEEGYAMLGTPAWEEAYGERVQDVLAVLQRQGVPAIWVGLPVMGSKNARSLHRLTEITRELVGKSNVNVRFIDNQDVLADAEGKFQIRESRPGREAVLLRRRDGKQTTRAGDELMVGRFLPVLTQSIRELVSARAARGEAPEPPEKLPITDVYSKLFR